MDRKGYQNIKDFQGCVVNDFKYLREWKREDPMADLTPIIPDFNEEKCDQCGVCEKVCPYGALSFDKTRILSPRSPANIAMAVAGVSDIAGQMR